MTETVFKRATRLQSDAARTGFDWPSLEGIFRKLTEELDELRAAIDTNQPTPEIQAELGDIFFVLINLARRLGVTPDDALADTCKKFERRFGHVCSELRKAGRRPEDSSLEEMEELWQAAKRLEMEGHRHT